MVFPFLTLQALSTGLTYEEVSVIYGLVPVFSIMAAPVAGFIGDKVGYKPVVVAAMILCGLSATSFTLVPIYSRVERTPSAQLVEIDGRHVVTSVSWPLCSSGNDTGEFNYCVLFIHTKLITFALRQL